MERFASDPDRRCCLRPEAMPENEFKIRILTLRFKNLSGSVEVLVPKFIPSRVSPLLPFRNRTQTVWFTQRPFLKECFPRCC